MGAPNTKLIAARVSKELADWIDVSAKRQFRNTSQQMEMMLQLAKTVIESQPLPPDPVLAVRSFHHYFPC